jgi:hypothetical protein
MEVSIEAKRNGVAFRRPTFKNPLPKFFKAIWNFIVQTGYVAGTSRAAAELHRQGYHEEAKQLMLDLAKYKESK